MLGAKFSDVDVCAVLTARLFIDPSSRKIDVADLPLATRLKVTRLKTQRYEWHQGGAFTEAEARAIAAMETIRVSMAEYSTSFTDIAFLCKRKVAFSGTVAIPRAMRLGSVELLSGTTIGWAPIDDETESEREIRRNLKRAGVVCVDEAAILTRETLRGVGCLIDACGALSGTSPSAVVSAIRSALPDIRVSIFVDEKGRVQGRCTDPDPSRCFYYFNQRSSRGVDVRMPHTIKGAVAMRLGETTATEVAQAVYRMRLVESKVHTIVLLVIGCEPQRGSPLTIEAVMRELERTESVAAKVGGELFERQRARTIRRLGVAASPRELLGAFTVRLDPQEVLRSIRVSTSTSTSRSTSTSTTMTQVAVGGGIETLTSPWYDEQDEKLTDARVDAWISAVTARDGQASRDKYAREYLWLMFSEEELHHVEENGANSWRKMELTLAICPHKTRSYDLRRGRRKVFNEYPDVGARNPRYLAHFALGGASTSTREPIANVTLRAFTRDVRSQMLLGVLGRIRSVIGWEVETTERMLLEHPRIDRRYCVVIEHERRCVLATLADLLLEGPAELCKRPGSRIYGVRHASPVTYWVRSEYLEGKTTVDESPSPAVLYLLACLGGALSNSEQETVLDIETAMRGQDAKIGDRGATLLRMHHGHRDIASARPAGMESPVPNVKLAIWMELLVLPPYVLEHVRSTLQNAGGKHAAAFALTRDAASLKAKDQERLIRSILRVGVTDVTAGSVKDAYRRASAAAPAFAARFSILFDPILKERWAELDAFWALLLGDASFESKARFGRRFV